MARVDAQDIGADHVGDLPAFNQQQRRVGGEVREKVAGDGGLPGVDGGETEEVTRGFGFAPAEVARRAEEPRKFNGDLEGDAPLMRWTSPVLRSRMAPSTPPDTVRSLSHRTRSNCVKFR